MLLIISVACFCWYGNRKKLHCEAVLLEKGYGYVVLYGRDTLIYQPYIPAIGKKATFSTEEDALKVANMVCRKLVQKTPPNMTKNEIDSLGVFILETK